MTPGPSGATAGAPGAGRPEADVLALHRALDDAPEGRAEPGEIVVDARLGRG
ncbi:hypothetical protein [Streptomyces sp. WAC 06738]|uniref:hypothetical protein n=1 Tax=Streptomyces sp. WAC 06738 TaxID=2203210 RepID=UPI001F0CBE8A|nr:hypothetical protein [Streptomyces sp. WAC 06738]